MKLGVITRHPVVKHLTDLALKVLPIAGLVSIGAYVAAQQAISPHRRVIKFAVLLGLMTLMLRFDMVYSVYLFAVRHPFPSGVSIGSTNNILMTVIPLIWAVRAISTKSRVFFRKTNVDWAIKLLLFAYLLSFINVETTKELTKSLKVMWTLVSAIIFFYLIVTFVDDEKKIFALVRITCVVCTVVMLTALMELFMPGQALIPGWIGLQEKTGMGELGYRIEGMRVGGALKSQAMVADFGTRSLFMMILLAVRVRSPFEKTFWMGASLLTIMAVVATANRGAFFSFLLGFIVLAYLFRKQISMARMAIMLGAVAAVFTVSEVLLTKHTHAVSLTARVLKTRVEGGIPETRKNTWLPAFRKSFEHPFVGHGPFYDVGEGLSYQMWPHNCYIYAFYTTGLVGVLALFAVLYQVWKCALSFRLPNVRGSPLADLSKVMCAVLGAALFQQLRTDFQRGDVDPFMMWLVFGLTTATALALKELSRNNASGAPNSPAAGGDQGRKRPPRRRPRGPFNALTKRV